MSKRNRDKGRSPQFVKVYPYVMRCDAWKITSKGARLLFIALKVNYSSNFQNNGRVYLSKRRAEEEFGLSHSNVTRWYRELQHYRFIVQTQRPYLGVEGRGKPAKWRLTDEPYNGEPATNDFLKWDGVLFEPEPKTESRTSGKSTPDLPQVHQWTSGKSTPAKSGPMVSPYLVNQLLTSWEQRGGCMRSRSKERGGQAVRPEDDGQRLRRLRREALEAAEEAYIYGDANSYSYDAMRRAMALDKELSKFRLVPKRQCEAETTDLSAAIMAGGAAAPTVQ